MVDAAYGSLPFEEQIAFFRAKRAVLTESWLDVFGAEHDTAFMVAGANRDNLLGDFRAAIDRAIAEGATLEEFRRDFDKIVATHGWDYKGGRNWRSRVIYETNLRQAYNAGRWQQLQQLKRVRPYWEYKHSDAVEHPRPMHVSWDGLVLHADDPWWHTHFPANGWGCQCYVQALSERDLKRRGKAGPDKAPAIEMETATVGQRGPGGPRPVETPKGIDPGFGYAPGRSLGGGSAPIVSRTPPSLAGQLEQAAQHALAATARLPAEAAVASVEKIFALERAVETIDAGYAAWQTSVVAAGQSRNLAYWVGAIDSPVVQALQGAGISPMTAAVVARDIEVISTIRDVGLASLSSLRALTADELARMPAVLRTPATVLLDVARRELLYVSSTTTRGGARKVVVSLSAETQKPNSFQAAGLVDVAELRAALGRGDLAVIKGSL